MRMMETSIDIDAPAERVFEILTDLEGYEREGWNEYIRSFTGALEPGTVLRAAVRQVSGKEIRLKVRVVSGSYPELRWEKKAPIPGVVHAEHWFRVDPLGPARCRFVQGEHITGALTFAVFHLVERSRQGFERFNAALKRRAEQGLPPTL
ncbi:SRPBCC domain-containing protein [Streptomyces flaveolus]|uniref:SRPBCC domain-containing protein n=1 Tax=Streptomyces flaveolus TaxID=67297 RepID=UPI00341CBFF5